MSRLFKAVCIIWVLIIIGLGLFVLLGCNHNKSEGRIVAHGIDRVDITAMMESIKIEVTDRDEKYQEMYWIIISSDKTHKVFVNQFFYEDNPVGKWVKLDPDCSDIRFTTEY